MPENNIQMLSVISFSATGGAMARFVKEKMHGMQIRLYGKYSTDAGAGPETPLLAGKTNTGEDPSTNTGEEPSTDAGRLPSTDAGTSPDQDEIPVTCSIAVWAGERMKERDAILFIGAAGIAVRSIAPHIKNKLVDSPVLVMDELGKHIIPLLSGHVGGANELALLIAEAVGAEPVITTATDLHDRFAVDVFAKKHFLRIGNKNGIAPISSKVLRGGKLTMAVEDGCLSEEVLRSLPEGISAVRFSPGETETGFSGDISGAATGENGATADLSGAATGENAVGPAFEGRDAVDILISDRDFPAFRTIWLAPKPYIIGIGCRKEKDAETIETFVNGILAEHKISHAEIRAVASIDIKKEEPGILAFCRKYRLPFITFPAEELLAASGEYEESAFVKKTVGVGNVCERAAACAAAQITRDVSGQNAERRTARESTSETTEAPHFVVRKMRGDGVTCSIARWK